MHTGKSHKKRQVYCDPIDDTLPSRLQLVAERTSPRRPVRNALKPLSINVDRPMMERLRDHKGQLRNAFASPSARRAVAHHGFVTPRKSETRGVKRKRSAKTTTSAQTQEAMLSPRKTRTQSRLAARRKAYDSEDSDVEQDGMEVEDAAQDTDDGFEDVTSSSSAPEPGSDVHEEEDDDAFYLEHAAQSQLMKLRKTRLIDLCTSAGLFDDDAELETLTKAILVDSILHWRTHRDSPDETSSEEASGSESSVQSPQMNRVRVGRTLRTRRGPSPTRPKVPDHRRLPYQTRSSLPSLCALTDAQLEISSQTTFGRSPTKPRRLRHVPSRARLRRQHTALPREYRNALDRRVRPESTAQYESTDDEWEAASAADDDSDADDQEDMPSPPKRQRSSTRVAFQGRSSEPQSRLVSRTHARRSQASDSAEDRESGRSSRSSKLAKGTTPVARRTRQATGGSITAIDFALADSHPVESDSEDEASHHSSHRSLRSSLRVSRSESVASQSSMRRRTRSGQHEVIVDEEEAVDPFSHPIMTDDEGSDRQDSDPDTDEEISITQTVGDDEDANEDVTITEDDAASRRASSRF
ncbi:uncharacterized protein L969DRAFT_356707 [Mixia osmundae IAM 14324]|uniref:uncharacterized protein n=1 Tax=Mixia osmundae (strain CBS 9802 / IAM 14324 / JCM 22182 / KY 12970) TaxID=764103 RepID=UPI0004A552F4|nr:uncharacterized protein L969DRAFT_356707 [Mixia osmundae IAM 14324]KEI40813.1 hypothetical protein L969DRAFT_356707 [Mixia osmundae IAM 14324]